MDIQSKLFETALGIEGALYIKDIIMGCSIKT